ncbi:MAG: hypothetical protein R3F65_16145 [bacterium]|nr:hypothetical protein [Myxococcales bacterium]MCB9541586.1 hypothetical protein [Myxococcales bacterium]MCB9552473.1 hypothetical protein [Myxococcales bacterium]
MTSAALDAIERRCEAATAGPWVAWVEGRDHTSGSDFVQTAEQDIEMIGATPADHDFIAHAREDVPRLVAEVRRLRALLDGIEGEGGDATT